MVKRDKRSFKQQHLDYWTKRHLLYPFYEHQIIYFWSKAKGITYTTDHLNTCIFPKLKRHRFYPKEYNMYSKIPKWSRKTYTTRPLRRATSRYLLKIVGYQLIHGYSVCWDEYGVDIPVPISKRDSWTYW